MKQLAAEAFDDDIVRCDCPSPESSAANCAAASGSTSITATCQPFAASRWQTAAPIAPAPPVTIATLPDGECSIMPPKPR